MTAGNHPVAMASFSTVADTRHPEAFAGVLLEDPFWRLPVTRYQDRRVAADAADDLLSLQAASAEQRAAIGRARYPHWDQAEVQAWAKAKTLTDPWIVENGDIIPTRPWPQLVADVIARGIPIRIVTATDRIGITPEHQALAESLGAEVIVAEGAGHFIRRDATGWFAAQSLGFFDRACRRTIHP